MKRIRTTYQPEEISEKLARAEEYMAAGMSMAEAAEAVSVKYITLYQWRRKFSVSGASEIRRIKRLEVENARLLRLLREFGHPASTSA
ncbi:MAG: transposase [Terricaulis sp.]